MRARVRVRRVWKCARFHLLLEHAGGFHEGQLRKTCRGKKAGRRKLSPQIFSFLLVCLSLKKLGFYLFLSDPFDSTPPSRPVCEKRVGRGLECAGVSGEVMKCVESAEEQEAVCRSRALCFQRNVGAVSALDGPVLFFCTENVARSDERRDGSVERRVEAVHLHQD